MMQVAANITHNNNRIKGVVSHSVKGWQQIPANGNRISSPSYSTGFRAVTLIADNESLKRKTGQITGTNRNAHTTGSKQPSEYLAMEPEQAADVELPEAFAKYNDEQCMYYHGKRVSNNELVQMAVKSGRITLDPNERNIGKVYKEAFRVMIQEEAAPKYGWSGTLYSEDGKYTFTPKEDGSYTWHLVEDAEMGASLDDIANWLCSGNEARSIRTGCLNYLRRLDPDLYVAARRIGNEVSTYDMMTGLYMEGELSGEQHEYDLTLLMLLFGTGNRDAFYTKLMNCKESGDFSTLLNEYSPCGAERLLELRCMQSRKTGGIL